MARPIDLDSGETALDGASGTSALGSGKVDLGKSDPFCHAIH
jgi:hypothetical protein